MQKMRHKISVDTREILWFFKSYLSLKNACMTVAQRMNSF